MIYERKTSWLAIAIFVGALGAMVLVGVLGIAWSRVATDKLSTMSVATSTEPTPTTSSTVDYIEQEMLVYSYGSSTINELVRLPKAGYSPEELQAYLRSRWAFHAAKEPSCTFVRDERLLQGDRIASFDLFKERICLFSETLNKWETTK